MVISSAQTSIQPLVERLTIGSRAGSSCSLLINDSLIGDSPIGDSPGAGESATTILPPEFSDVEPRSYPDVLDRQRETQDQFHGQRQQHAHREKLKSQILKQTGSRQELLLKLILRKQILLEWTTEPDALEVDRHQPVEEQRADDEEPAHHKHSEDELGGIVCQESQTYCFSNRTLRNHVVQVDVLIKHDRIVIPCLSRPEPDPTRSANKCADHDQKDPLKEAGAEHPQRKSSLPERVVTIAQRI